VCIVVGDDGSDTSVRAREVACELARAIDDEIVFVTAWRELRGDFGLPLHRLLPDLLESQRNFADEILDAAKRFADSRGVESETVSCHGDAAAAIRDAAEERQARLIVVGSHGSGPIQSVVYGSVTRRLLHHPPCPVLVVPPHSHALCVNHAPLSASR
jgi:nucleotide-binding universal stress UspA family protein